MPAAAVIPAPIAYIKVVAVKKLVVGHEVGGRGRPEGWTVCRCLLVGGFVRKCETLPRVTVKKLECSRQARA